MADQEVTVKFLSDTKQYQREVGAAERAQDDLTQSIEQTEAAQDDLEGTTSNLSEGLGDLGTSLTQTGEGALDAATGMSGLGAAFTQIIGRAKEAVKGMSAFGKALLFTGAGAAVAALAAIVIFWEDISKFIGLSTSNLEDFNETTSTTNKRLDTQLQIWENLGASVKFLNEQEIKNLEIKAENAKLAAAAAQADLDALLKRQSLVSGIAGAGALFNKSIGKQIALIGELTQEADLASSAIERLTREQEEAAEVVAENNRQLAEDNRQTAIKAEEAANAAAALQQLENAQRTYNAAVLEGAPLNGGELERRRLEAAEQLGAFLDTEAKKQDKRDKKAIGNTDEITDAKLFAAQSTFDLTTDLADENQQLQGSLLIAEATANTALGITRVLGTPGQAFKIAGIIAIGAAQIAAIAKSMQTSSEGTPSAPASATEPVERADIVTESARPDTQQVQTVLVTEDLNSVQSRVAITENRGTIR